MFTTECITPQNQKLGGTIKGKHKIRETYGIERGEKMFNFRSRGRQRIKLEKKERT